MDSTKFGRAMYVRDNHVCVRTVQHEHLALADEDIECQTMLNHATVLVPALLIDR